jgi:hypothetical protein
MMKPMIAVIAAAAALAACQPAPKDGISLTEKRLAEKIIDAGVLMPLDKQGLEQIAFQQVQGMMYQDGLQPQEARQVMLSLSKNLEASVPEIKQQLVETLAGEFNAKELELLLKLVASKEGKAINEKMQVVGEKSSEQLRAHVQVAGAKALDDVRKAWPTPPPPAPPAPPAGQSGPAIPGLPPGAPIEAPH